MPNPPQPPTPPVHRTELRVRDPFIVAHAAKRIYYLFGTNLDEKPAGFDCYQSTDLEYWYGRRQVWTKPRFFWGKHSFWAPEVHFHRGLYHLIASFKSDRAHRGTQTFIAETPFGPYSANGDGPVTPAEWDCLDGTLHLDEARQPWMIFCHEWAQVGDGRICAMPMSEDLRKPAGEPVELFTASQAPWAQPLPREEGCYVTDGPWLHRTAWGNLLMLWSSFDGANYNIGISRSTTGHILGPWQHESQPLLSGDEGGHGMLFRTFEGQLTLAIHAPNSEGNERAVFIPIAEVERGLTLMGIEQPQQTEPQEPAATEEKG